MPRTGEFINLNVQETVSADFLGVLDVTCLERLRYLPGRRSVWKARCSGRAILLKLYDPHPKQERDAVCEWHHATQIAELNIDLPAPLFFARSADGVLAVAFDYIPDGQTLNQVFVGSAPQECGEVMKLLIALHAKQHDAGMYQRDDHLGNYLWAEGKLWMLDAGTCEISNGALSDESRRNNMAMLAAGIPLSLRAEYDTAYSHFYDVKLEGLAGAVSSSIQTRQKNYSKKTRRACSEFEHEKNSGADWLACRDVDAELKNKLLQNPDQFFGAGEDMIKNGRTCSVVDIELNGKSYILKRYNQKSLAYRLLHMLTTPRVLSSWSSGHVLRLFGIPTPRPMVCLIYRTGPMFRKGYLLMEKISGESPYWMDREDVADPSKGIPTQFVSRLHELDALKATHGDMKASNFILDDSGVLQLIDLDSMIFHRSNQSFEREKGKDLARFMRNWEDTPELIKLFCRELEVTFS